MWVKIISDEEKAIRAAIEETLNVDQDTASALLNQLGNDLQVPKIEKEIPEEEIQLRLMTIHDSGRKLRVRSRKLGNFVFNWRKLIDQQDLTSLGIEYALDGVTSWLLTYKVIRFGLAGSVIDFDEKESFVFYCLYNNSVLPEKTASAYTKIRDCVEKQSASSFSQEEYHQILDALTKYQVIKLKDDIIHQNETVIKRK